MVLHDMVRQRCSCVANKTEAADIDKGATWLAGNQREAIETVKGIKVLAYIIFGCAVVSSIKNISNEPDDRSTSEIICLGEDSVVLVLLCAINVCIIILLIYQKREKLSKRLARVLAALNDPEYISCGTQTDISLPPEWIPDVLERLLIGRE